jgi:hypothetical protein
MSDKVEGEYFTNWACSFRGNIHSVASEKILTIWSYFSDVVGVFNASNGDNNSIWIADPVEKADEESDTLNTYDRKYFTGWDFNLKCVDEELSVGERQRIFRKNIAQWATWAFLSARKNRWSYFSRKFVPVGAKVSPKILERPVAPFHWDGICSNLEQKSQSGFTFRLRGQGPESISI